MDEPKLTEEENKRLMKIHRAIFSVAMAEPFESKTARIDAYINILEAELYAMRDARSKVNE